MILFCINSVIKIYVDDGSKIMMTSFKKKVGLTKEVTLSQGHFLYYMYWQNVGKYYSHLKLVGIYTVLQLFFSSFGKAGILIICSFPESGIYILVGTMGCLPSILNSNLKKKKKREILIFILPKIVLLLQKIYIWEQ